MSNEARNKDIAALLARGVARVKKQPLVAKAIEFHMLSANASLADEPYQDESANRDDQPNLGKWLLAKKQGRAELESHHVQLTRQLTRDHGEIRELALEQNPSGSLAHRIADLQNRIAKAEYELAKFNRQLHDLETLDQQSQ